MNPQHYYSRLISNGRRDNPTFSEAQRDLARMRELELRVRHRAAA